MADKSDNVFQPKPGRIRSLGGVRTKSYINRILKQMSVAGKGKSAFGGSRTFTGYRIGRGNNAVRRQRAGHNFASTYRRVIIKTRIVKFNASGQKSGIGAARAHLNYIQRDGTAEKAEPGQLYDAAQSEGSSDAFLERSEGDRHQFRFIVSPEDGTELADLKPFVRDLMRAMEQDLDTKLDWVAVDHFNTAHPHTHIVLRGKDGQGNDLVISRDYIAQGMRCRASEILTRELGPQSLREVSEKLRQEVDQNRFTNLDRELVREVADRIIETNQKPKTSIDRFKHAMRMGRLQHLERQGLAKNLGDGEWELSPKLETTLRRAGERGDIIKTMHRGLARAGIDAGASEYAIFDPQDDRAKSIMGAIVDRGLHDELNDGHYIMVDAEDGRLHHIALDPKQDMDDLPIGAIVEVHPAVANLKTSDRTISSVADNNDGLYSPLAHSNLDPSASAEFVQAHVRRLESLQRTNIVRRFSDGSWEIPDNFAEMITNQQKHTAHFPGDIKVLSSFSLEGQIKAEGATWLDQKLLAPQHVLQRNSRFSNSVTTALQARQKYLIEQALAVKENDTIRYRRNLLSTLQQHELLSSGNRVSSETNLPFVHTAEGEHFEGVYRKPVRLASGKFAIIENAKEFTLVPWKPVLERQRGKAVAGVLRGTSASFDFIKRRSIGIG